jgi:eukaryotic-like serine/threonine-protein kinase
MGLLQGSRVGPYEVLSSLGAGGMGEVYSARDTTLDRIVALKVLPGEFAADAERVARFEREAKTLAALNHPRIATIHAIERTGTTFAIVMKLVEGEDLSGLLARGALPVDEAISIADQIAEALDAAHQQGVIHRDLKPANIKVDEHGAVTVLDFGIAKAITNSSGEAANAAATITTPAMTARGVILGTAAYMSPEQAKGKPVDRRTDIWSFGCVLYEMLTGRRPFDGEDTTDVMAAIVSREPDWSRVPSSTPPAVVRLMRRCLEKDRARRLRDMGDARLELSDRDARRANLSAAGRGAVMLWAAVTLLLVAVVALAGWQLRNGARAKRQAPSMRMAIELPQHLRLSSNSDPAISPDGSFIAFTATDEDGLALWLRPVANSTPRKIAGTYGADTPFWSPDSRELAFFGEGRLKILRIDDGSVQSVSDAPSPRGGAWIGSNIVFVPLGNGPLTVISRKDGVVTRVLEETRALAPYYPQPLDDDDHVIFHSRLDGTVHVASLRSGKSSRVKVAGGPPVFSAGHLFYAKDRSIVAQVFDTKNLSVVGDAVRIEDGGNASPGGSPGFSISQSGLLVRPTQPPEIRQLVWVDRKGDVVRAIGEPSRIANFSVSPDEKRAIVALSDSATGSRVTSLIDLDSGIGTRFQQNGSVGVWSDDNRSVLLQLRKTAGTDMLTMVDLAGKMQASMEVPVNGRPRALLPGRRIVMDVNSGGETGQDIVVVPLDGGPRLDVLKTRANEGQARISPNLRSIAYVSDETGRLEVYLQSFPVPGRKVRVSTEGGYWPRWRADGKELFFLSGQQVMSASVNDSAEPQVGKPQPLFKILFDAFGAFGVGDPFEVSRDGQRFLTVNAPKGGTLSVLLNWESQLSRE